MNQNKTLSPKDMVVVPPHSGVGGARKLALLAEEFTLCLYGSKGCREDSVFQRFRQFSYAIRSVQCSMNLWTAYGNIIDWAYWEYLFGGLWWHYCHRKKLWRIEWRMAGSEKTSQNEDLSWVFVLTIGNMFIHVHGQNAHSLLRDSREYWNQCRQVTSEQMKPVFSVSSNIELSAGQW